MRPTSIPRSSPGTRRREKVQAIEPRAYILSGGPSSVYDADAPQLPAYVLDSGKPILGICYGLHALAKSLGGHVLASSEREYGRAALIPTAANSLILPQSTPFQVWMSHGDRIDRLPAGFVVTATSDNCPIAAFEDPQRKIFAIQFHPEVNHTERGRDILAAFIRVTGVRTEWTPGSMVETAVSDIRARVGDAPVIAAVSGGVDSMVAAALVHRAVGDQLTCVFVDTGMLRAGEPQAVVKAFNEILQARLIAVNASEEYLDALAGVTDPEEKRKIIGEKFIRIFEREARVPLTAPTRAF